MLLIACLVLNAVGCKKEAATKEYVARVGDAVLTEKDIAAAVGPASDAQRRQFIGAWVSRQLLFQEAARKGFTESPDVRAQLEEASQQLALNAYLQNEIYGDSVQVTDEMIAREFSAHRDQYRVGEDVVRMSFAIFDERDAANVFRSRVLRGASWDESLQQMRDNGEPGSHVLRAESDKYFAQAMLYPEELWKIARTLSKEDISYVVNTKSGYCVVRVRETIRQGEVPTLEYAKDEIRKRLEVARRTERYDELLTALRAKGDVDIRLSNADTSSQQSDK